MEKDTNSTQMTISRNVGKNERILSGISGSLFMLNAIRKGSIPQGVAGGYLLFRAVSGFCPTYRLFGKKEEGFKVQNVNIRADITVNRPLEEVYAFWRKLDNLPLFMEHLERVTVLDDRLSVWTVVLPGGVDTLTWTSEIVEDELNDRIGWRSLPDSDIETAGNVHFRDAGKFGTRVYAVISYRAPAGKLGEGVGRLLNPLFEKTVKKDLQSFRRYLEDLEIPAIEGQTGLVNDHITGEA